MFPSTIYICLLIFLFVSVLLFTAATLKMKQSQALVVLLCSHTHLLLPSFVCRPRSELIANDYEHTSKELSKVRKSCAEHHNEEYCQKFIAKNLLPKIYCQKFIALSK